MPDPSAHGKKPKMQRTAYPHIVKVEGVCGGKAVIEGTRFAVWHLVNYYYEVGMTVEAILADWTYLTPAQVFSALAYYHDNKEEIDQIRRENSEDARGQAQIKRNQGVIQLLDSWAEGTEEDAAEQRETWKYLKQALDEDRMSDRPFYPLNAL